jgi:hypothetical protein
MEDIFEEIHNNFIQSEDFLSYMYELQNYCYDITIDPYIYNYEKNN